MGCYFLQAHSSNIGQTRFNPTFHPCVAMVTKPEFVIPSKLFWFVDHIKWRPHNMTVNPFRKIIVESMVAFRLDLPIWFPVSQATFYSEPGRNYVSRSIARPDSIGNLGTTSKSRG